MIRAVNYEPGKQVSNKRTFIPSGAKSSPFGVQRMSKQAKPFNTEILRKKQKPSLIMGK